MLSLIEFLSSTEVEPEVELALTRSHKKRAPLRKRVFENVLESVLSGDGL